MVYSKKLLIDVAMTDFLSHFAITSVIRGNGEIAQVQKDRLRKELENEYDDKGKNVFRKLNGITPQKIRDFKD